MATIRKRGERWQVQVRRDGSHPVSRSFLLKADAVAWARQMEVEADRRGMPVDVRILDKTILREVMERYRDEVIVNKRCSYSETMMMNGLLKRSFCKLALSAVTPAAFNVYRDERLKSVKPATICRELGVLQHMFEVIIKEWGLPLSVNPLKAVRRPAVDGGRERRIQSEDELKALIASADECRNKLMGPLFLFAIETGMRRGELVRMRWSDLDLSKRTLHIPITKNGHPRTIPLSSKALAILKGLKTDDDDEERVFPMTLNAIKLGWKRLRERAKADDLRFHDLRHEAVSSFFERGLSVPEVALISGHRDARMLFRYTHLKAEDLADKLG